MEILHKALNVLENDFDFIKRLISFSFINFKPVIRTSEKLFLFWLHNFPCFNLNDTLTQLLDWFEGKI